MVEVESEAIAEIAYDSRTSTMTVRFVGGDWYRYFDVPSRVYEEFVAAESHGRFFQNEIRDRYAHRRGR